MTGACLGPFLMANRLGEDVEPRYPTVVAPPSTKNFSRRPLLLKVPAKVSKNLFCNTVGRKFSNRENILVHQPYHMTNQQQ
jgi:hypothetical protein